MYRLPRLISEERPCGAPGMSSPRQRRPPCLFGLQATHTPRRPIPALPQLGGWKTDTRPRQGWAGMRAATMVRRRKTGPGRDLHRRGFAPPPQPPTSRTWRTRKGSGGRSPQMTPCAPTGGAGRACPQPALLARDQDRRLRPPPGSTEASATTGKVQGLGRGGYEPSRKKGPEAKTVTWLWNPLSSRPLAGRVGGVGGGGEGKREDTALTSASSSMEMRPLTQRRISLSIGRGITQRPLG